MKKKILILENVGQIEEVLASFIKRNHADDEIKIITNLPHVPQSEIIEALKWCDVLAIQSIFDGVKQLESFIELIEKLKIRPMIYLIHTTGEMLQTLNRKISKPSFEILKNLLQHGGLSVLNITYKTYETAEPGAFFKSLTHYFGFSYLWYNEAKEIIWDQHQHIIDWVPASFYKKQTYFAETALKSDLQPIFNAPKTILDDLNKDEIHELKKMLREMYAQLEEREEDIEIGETAKWCGEIDTIEIAKEVAFRKSILDKMKITLYK